MAGYIEWPHCKVLWDSVIFFLFVMNGLAYLMLKELGASMLSFFALAVKRIQTALIIAAMLVLPGDF